MFPPPPNISDSCREIIAAHNSGWIAAMNNKPPHPPFNQPKLRQAWTDGYKNCKA
jgi:ribosome modulation factor